MENKVSKINFKENVVVAVIKVPSLNKSGIKVDKVSNTKDTINVNYSYSEGEKQSFSTTAVDILTIKRTDYKEGQKIEVTEK